MSGSGRSQASSTTALSSRLYVVLAVIVALALVVLTLAKRRSWI